MTSKEDLLDRVAGLLPGELPCVLVVFAHPDDEVLAIGGRLEHWRNAHFVCVTDGAPTDGADAREHGFASLDDYREARRRELSAAFADAALPPDTLHTLKMDGGSVIPDQQAVFAMPGIARAVVQIMKQLRPEVVLTHPYEGGHPDHDACAFAVHAAVDMLGGSASLVVEAPSYYAAPNGMVTGQFLPYKGAGKERRYVLSAAEQQAKRRRLACFASQQQTLAQFGCEVEMIREAPAYDFKTPPHAGELFYERAPWGITGERFRQLASAATAMLSRPGAIA